MNPVAISILLDLLNAKAKEVTTEAEQVALQKHIEEGAHGLREYLQSKRSSDTVRLVIDDYLEFLKTGS